MSGYCKICGAACRSRITGLFDDRFGHPGTFDLEECDGCGHRQLAAHFSDTDLVGLYSKYYPRRILAAGDFAPYREESGFRAWLNGARSAAYHWVPRQVRVLDIGCGFGQTLAYHRERGCDAWGVEADENVRPVAERQGLNLRCGVFDPAMFDAGSFDYVTMDQVIEHAIDPVQFMRGAASLLRPGGQIVLSTPNSHGYGARIFGRRWINWHAPYHLQQFSRLSLALMARNSGLEIVSLRTLTSSLWLLFQWHHMTELPVAGSASSFWDPARSMQGRSQNLRRAVMLTHVLGFNHLVTRAVDAFGIGDNFLCVLRKPS